MNNKGITELEAEVLKWLLDGNDPVLMGLREQLSNAKVASREYTGVGFYLNFEISPEVIRIHEYLEVKPKFCFGDVEATINSLRDGV